MKLSRFAKTLVERILKIHLYKRLPRGVDLIKDIQRALPGFQMDIIFDVGANEGQSVNFYLPRFPSAKIYCFEPARSTFDSLLDSTKDIERVECFNVALGAESRGGKLVHQGSSDMFFLLGQSSEVVESPEVSVETIQVETLDAFCKKSSITNIAFLKIDTEGGDLDVLRGAKHMLAEQRIDLIQVEAGMNPSNTRHVPIETLKEFLQSHQYYLFGLYEQVNEWPIGSPQLRRANPVFISQRLIDSYTSLA